MGVAKYYEDNYLIMDERRRDMEEQIVLKPVIKNKGSKHKGNRHDVLCPKKGVIDIVKMRGSLYITMEFRQHLFDEHIAALKNNGWKWDYRRKCWYAVWSFSNYDFAAEFVHGEKGRGEDPDDVYFDGYR